jgi:hypothetical protein
MLSSYIDKIASDIRRAADPDAAKANEDLPLYRLYAVLLLAKGKGVTAEDVHNAWAAWASEHAPTHLNLLPFKELSLETRHKDLRYLNAIREVASPI